MASNAHGVCMFAHKASEETRRHLSSFSEGLRVVCSLLCTPSWAAQVHAQLTCYFTSFSPAYLPKHMHAPALCQHNRRLRHP